VSSKSKSSDVLDTTSFATIPNAMPVSLLLSAIPCWYRFISTLYANNAAKATMDPRTVVKLTDALEKSNKSKTAMNDIKVVDVGEGSYTLILA
jgi:hypothetical protein